MEWLITLKVASVTGFFNLLIATLLLLINNNIAKYIIILLRMRMGGWWEGGTECLWVQNNLCIYAR